MEQERQEDWMNALTKEERRVEIKKLNTCRSRDSSDTRQLDESQLRLMHVLMGQLGYSVSTGISRYLR